MSFSITLTNASPKERKFVWRGNHYVVPANDAVELDLGYTEDILVALEQLGLAAQAFWQNGLSYPEKMMAERIGTEFGCLIECPPNARFHFVLVDSNPLISHPDSSILGISEE